MVTIDKQVDIDIDDIIDNLTYFSKSELLTLEEELSSLMNKEMDKKYTFDIKTLEDEYKFKILKEMFNKYTIEELDKLNKK